MCPNEPLPIPRIHAGNRQKVDQHDILCQNKMKKTLLPLVLTLLFVWCVNTIFASESTSEPSILASVPALWLETCVTELAHNQAREVRWFNNIGATDVEFLPEINAAEEIFLKCQSVVPISANQASHYKTWLEDRISEIQSITLGTTRSQVNRILRKNGGISTPVAAIYSHIKYYFLKVRIEFEQIPEQRGKLEFNGSDRVKAMSMPYLGLSAID